MGIFKLKTTIKKLTFFYRLYKKVKKKKWFNVEHVLYKSIKRVSLIHVNAIIDKTMYIYFSYSYSLIIHYLQ